MHSANFDCNFSIVIVRHCVYCEWTCFIYRVRSCNKCVHHFIHLKKDWIDNDNGSEEVEEIERKLHEKCGGIVVAASPFKIRNRCNIQPFTRARMQANAQSLLTAHIRYITKCTPPFPFIQKAKLQASNIFLFGYYVCGFAVVYKIGRLNVWMGHRRYTATHITISIEWHM